MILSAYRRQDSLINQVQTISPCLPIRILHHLDVGLRLPQASIISMLLARKPQCTLSMRVFTSVSLVSSIIYNVSWQKSFNDAERVLNLSYRVGTVASFYIREVDVTIINPSYNIFTLRYNGAFVDQRMKTQ